MTLTGIRNKLILVIVVVLGLAVYDASNGDNDLPDIDHNDRVVKIKFILHTKPGGITGRFDTDGQIGNTPFSEDNKTDGYVKVGVGKSNQAVRAEAWLNPTTGPLDYFECEIWQGNANITAIKGTPVDKRSTHCAAVIK